MEVKGDLNIDGTLTVNNSPVTGGSGISNVVEDTTPQLGGNLDTNGKIITGTPDNGTNAGSVTITAVDGVTTPGSVNITSGSSTNQTGGDINIVAGNGNVDGGSIFITPGAGATDVDGSVFIGKGLGNGSVISVVDPMVLTNTKISNMADPTSPQDAATKAYVDAQSGGGFYGVVWSDGFITVRTDRLSFSNRDFYLDGAKPTVNLKDSVLRADGSVVANNLNIGSSDVMVLNGGLLDPDLAINSDVQVVFEKDTATDTASIGSIDYFGRSRGTHAVRQAVQDGDALGTIMAVGHDGTDFNTAARVDFVVEGAVSTDIIPAKIRVRQTSPTGALNDTLSIHSDGYVTVNDSLSVGNIVTAEAFYLKTGGEVSPLTVREEDGSPSISGVKTIRFTNGTVTDNGGGDVSVAITAGGVTIKDDVHTLASQSTIGLNAKHFYLSQGASGNAVINLRYDKDIYPVYIDFPTTQQIAVDPFAQYPYTIEKVDFDCLSGTATGGFYIVRAANRGFARDGTAVTGLDPLNFSSTATTKLATGANTVNPGDVVQFSLYQNSGARKVRLVLTCKKP